jgi:hypothetical protein
MSDHERIRELVASFDVKAWAHADLRAAFIAETDELLRRIDVLQRERDEARTKERNSITTWLRSLCDADGTHGNERDPHCIGCIADGFADDITRGEHHE